MKTITSKDNPIIKEAASLQEKKYRDRLGMYLLEGPNPVREYMDIGGRPRFIFIKAGAGEEIQGIVSRVKEPTAVYELSEDAFLKISTANSPQGIVAVVDKQIYTEESFFTKVRSSNILVLDRIQDPGNIGTLLRSAEAMGFGGVVFVKGCADPYQPKVVRAAASSIFRIPVLFADDSKSAARLIKRSGKTLYAASMTGEISVDKADLRENTAIIIGNEGNGVSSELLDCSTRLFIPMEGSTESLNAAIAACIIMYESKRQRL